MYKPQLNGAKPINVNSGSGSVLAKKAATKYSKRLNNSSGNFNLNSSNKQTYIGNPNSQLSYTGCQTNDTNLKTSVKTYSGYILTTRIVNGELKKNINISLNCYKNNNTELENLYINKHLSNAYNNNKDSDTRTRLLKARCRLDRTNYLSELQDNTTSVNCLTQKNNGAGNSSNVIQKYNNCRITKDMIHINKGYIPDYDLYYNSPSLFNGKKCNYNPPNITTIAC